MSNLAKTMIQIPKVVVHNRKINGKAFAVYYYLKYISFRKWGDKTKLEINHLEMKYKLGIKDNRVIVAALKVLFENRLIEEEIRSMPIHSLLKITLSKVDDDKFVQLPIQLLDKIPSIKPNGLRLIYYYESFINRRTSKNFSFPSFEKISEDTGLNHNTIIKYNNILKKNKLIKIEKHQVEHEWDGTFVKYNNHYKVRWENIQKSS